MITDFPNLNEPATQANLAKLLGVARSTVHGHHEADTFTEGESLGVWMREYFAKIQASAAGRTENDDALRAVTIRERSAKARQIELAIAKEEGFLVLRDDVLAELSPLVLHIRTTLDALPARVSSALAAQYGHPIDKRLIENECRHALSAIADYTPDSATPD